MIDDFTRADFSGDRSGTNMMFEGSRNWPGQDSGHSGLCNKIFGFKVDSSICKESVAACSLIHLYRLQYDPNIGFWSHWFSMPWQMGTKGHPWSKAKTSMTGQCPKENHHFCDDHIDWRHCAIGVGTPPFIKEAQPAAKAIYTVSTFNLTCFTAHVLILIKNILPLGKQHYLLPTTCCQTQRLYSRTHAIDLVTHYTPNLTMQTANDNVQNHAHYLSLSKASFSVSKAKTEYSR